jgi:hypothetical protein
MPSSPERPQQQLNSFLGKYTPEIGKLARAALAKMRKRYPTALELVYDNYNALAIGFSPTERSTEAIFSIALYPRWVSLFFLQARGRLQDPQGLLKGSGSVVRHIVLDTADLLDDPGVVDLMKQAERLADVPFSPNGKRALIIKSVSAQQRPRVPVPRKGR